jgi:hypothetical protein
VPFLFRFSNGVTSAERYGVILAEHRRSWRAHEIYVKIAGSWTCLYRDVDSAGETIDFMLSLKRDLTAARLFLRLALLGHVAGDTGDQCRWTPDRSVATCDVRGLLVQSRRPPICGHTSSVPRHGLRGLGCLKQLPKPVFQEFDGLPQSSELPNPDYRDGPVQVKRWGTQDFHGIARMIPGNKASRQQPDTITGLNERKLQMHVVDFSRDHWGEAGTLHLIDEPCPKKAAGWIEHPGCSAQAFPIIVNVACGALNDLHAVASDGIRQKRWRRGFTFGQKHGCNVEVTGEEPVK